MNFSKHLGNGLHLASLAFFAIDLFGKTQSWPVLLAYSVCHSIRSYGWVEVDIQTIRRQKGNIFFWSKSYKNGQCVLRNVKSAILFFCVKYSLRVVHIF